MLYILIHIFLNEKFITSASSLTNASLESFNSTEVQATQKNFFYVQKNGLGILRRGNDYVANIYYDFYRNLCGDFEKKFQVIMILGIIFLIISIFILIPIVFSVHRTNNRVLSLFGLIPLQEIRELANKCEKYILNFLIEKENRKEITEEIEDENKNADVQGQEPEKSNIFIFR